MKKPILLLCLLFFFYNEARSYSYFNSEIKRLCTNTELVIPLYLPDTLITLQATIAGQKLPYHFHINKASIHHVGVPIFSDVLVCAPGFSGDLYRYIERKLLSYALENRQDNIDNDLQQNKAVLLVNGEILNERTRSRYLETIILGSSMLTINIYSDSAHIECTLKSKSTEIFFSIKKSFYLITGLNKTEADVLLFNAVSKYKKDRKSQSVFLKEDILKIDDSIYAVQGREFMKILSSSYYLIKNDSSFIPLFHKKYPSKSFITTILKPEQRGDEISIVLEHKQYNSNKTTVVLLSELVEYFSRDHDLYFGIEDSSTSYSGTLIAYNHDLNYLHLLYFQTTREMLFSKRPEYRCELYSFIPTDNIKNMFSSNKSDEKKQYKVKRQ